MQEVARLVPEEQHGGSETWQAVVGKLHDEGHSLTTERGVLQHQGGEDAHQYAEEVEPAHHPRRAVGEEGGAEEGVDGQLGGARHEGGEHYGETPVAVGGQRAACHDAGHRAAEAHQQGHYGAAREPYLT